MTTSVSKAEQDEPIADVETDVVSDEAPTEEEGTQAPPSGNPVIKPDNWTNG